MSCGKQFPLNGSFQQMQLIWFSRELTTDLYYSRSYERPRGSHWAQHAKKEVGLQIVIVILQLMQHRKRKGAGANLFTRTGVFLSKYWDKPKYWEYGCNN